MKSFIAGFGAVLMYLTVLLFWIDGILLLSGGFGIVGTLIGIFIFPVGVIVGFLTIFASWWAFIGSVAWFGLVALMINYGDTN
jgi:hypothetical protein